MVDFSFEQLDPENMDDRVVPGKYHILIQNVDESDPTHSVVVDYEVLAGSVPGQEGKTGREFLSRTAKSEKRMALFVLAAGLCNPDAMIEAKRKGQRFTVSLSDAINRQICVEIVKSDNGYSNWTYQGIWAMDAAEAKDIPKNEGLLNQGGDADPLGGLDF